LTGALCLDEKASIIHIVKYKDPLPFLFVAQPVVHKLENIGRWILPPKDLDAVRYISKALFKPGRIACVDPENPRLWRAVSSSIGVFDGELRLASQQLAICINKAFTLTQHHLGQLVQSETLRQRISGGSDQVYLARQSLCRD
jgi:hypothetical protein